VQISQRVCAVVTGLAQKERAERESERDIGRIWKEAWEFWRKIGKGLTNKNNCKQKSEYAKFSAI
jgi:hypothetical protein